MNKEAETLQKLVIDYNETYTKVIEIKNSFKEYFQNLIGKTITINEVKYELVKIHFKDPLENILLEFREPSWKGKWYSIFLASKFMLIEEFYFGLIDDIIEID